MDNKPIYVTRSSMPTYEEYIEAIKPLWDSRWLTNMGTYHQQLEKRLSAFLKVPEISLTVNGHMALEMAIQSFDFPQGSEVITTPFTFISTTHAIVRNHLQPVFCDIKSENGLIDESRIEDLITEKTVAILPVHVFGNVCNSEAIQSIADKYGLKVIYDAAHAFGVEIDGVGVGNFGDVSMFSFHSTKVYNTIEGGAVVCKDHNLYEKLYNLKNFGIRGEELVVSVGANAKMNEFSAIMGLCNLNHVDNAISKRKKVFEEYKKALSDVEGIRFLIEERPEVKNNYAYCPIVVDDTFKYNRDEIYNKLRAVNIFARKYFYPITSDAACFKNKYRNTNVAIAKDISDRVLSLPIFEDLELEDVHRICDYIKG